MSNILVVDDEKIIATTLERVLKRAGHTVTVCHGGIEAIQTLQNNNGFDFIFLDFLMPEVGGGEVLDFAKKNLANVKVIMMTAYGDQQTKDSLLTRGASLVLAKPFDDIIELPNLLQKVGKKN